MPELFLRVRKTEWKCAKCPAHNNLAFNSSAARSETGTLMWSRVAWSPHDIIASLSPGPGSFFSWEALGTPNELFWCCNLPAITIYFRGPQPSSCEASHPPGDRERPLSLRDVVSGEKLLLPKRINLLNAGSLVIPDGCTIFPRWQAKDTCAYMWQVWSTWESLETSGQTMPVSAGLAVWWGRGCNVQPSALTERRYKALLNGDMERSWQALAIFHNR